MTSGPPTTWAPIEPPPTAWDFPPAETADQDGIVGVDNAGTTVTSSTPKPPKTAGERLTDEGDGGDKIATYLVGQKII